MTTDRRRTVGAVLAILSAASVPATAAIAQAPRTLTVTQDLRIDAAAQNLSTGMQLDIGRDGSIAVTQPEDDRILFFDAAGRLAGSVGRPGEGPGEFRTVGLHGRYADSLWVLDFQLRRITLISPEHKLVRVISWPPSLRLTPTDAAGIPTLLGVAPSAIVRDGGLVTILVPPRGFPRPPWYPATETRRPIVATDPRGVFQKLIGWEPELSGFRCDVSYRSATGEADVRIPFCALQWSSFSRDGSRIAMLEQQNAKSVTGRYHLVVISTTGDTIFSREYSCASIPIPRRAADSAIDALLAQGNRGRPVSPQYVATLRSLKVPENYPPIQRMSVGLDGTIWLEVQTAAAPHRWLVLSATGDPIGQLTVPASVSLMAESRNTVWGVERDQDDLESIVRYKVGS